MATLEVFLNSQVKSCLKSSLKNFFSWHLTIKLISLVVIKSIKDAIKKELVTRGVIVSPPDVKFIMPISPVLSQAAIQLVHRELTLKERA